MAGASSDDCLAHVLLSRCLCRKAITTMPVVVRTHIRSIHAQSIYGQKFIIGTLLASSHAENGQPLLRFQADAEFVSKNVLDNCTSTVMLNAVFRTRRAAEPAPVLRVLSLLCATPPCWPSVKNTAENCRAPGDFPRLCEQLPQGAQGSYKYLKRYPSLGGRPDPSIFPGGF